VAGLGLGAAVFFLVAMTSRLNHGVRKTHFCIGGEASASK
jgi:hypothetical protein